MEATTAGLVAQLVKGVEGMTASEEAAPTEKGHVSVQPGGRVVITLKGETAGTPAQTVALRVGDMLVAALEQRLCAFDAELAVKPGQPFTGWGLWTSLEGHAAKWHAVIHDGGRELLEAVSVPTVREGMLEEEQEKARIRTWAQAGRKVSKSLETALNAALDKWTGEVLEHAAHDFHKMMDKVGAPATPASVPPTELLTGAEPVMAPLVWACLATGATSVTGHGAWSNVHHTLKHLPSWMAGVVPAHLDLSHEHGEAGAILASVAHVTTCLFLPGGKRGALPALNLGDALNAPVDELMKDCAKQYHVRTVETPSDEMARLLG